MVLLCIAVYMNRFIKDDSNNYWYIHQSAYMFIFLYLGYLMKLKPIFEKKWAIVSLPIFLVTMMLILYIDKEVPFVTHKICVNEYIDIPLYLVLGTSGTVALLVISKLSCNKLLSYIGRNSLVMYCTHISILTITCYFVFHHFISPINWANTIFFYCLVLCIVILVLLCSIHLVNSKYFHWMLMK